METSLIVERSIVISARREQVWRAITEAGQISKWFDGQMQWAFEAATGEIITLSMNGDIIGTATIAAVKPPERFAFRWTAEPGNPTLTLVTFLLETVPEGTRVTISEEGFEVLPEDVRTRRFDMNQQGWGLALNHLTAYLQAGSDG